MRLWSDGLTDAEKVAHLESEIASVHEAYEAYMGEIHEKYPELGEFDPCDDLHVGDLVEKHILRPLCELLDRYGGSAQTIPAQPGTADPPKEQPSL